MDNCMAMEKYIVERQCMGENVKLGFGLFVIMVQTRMRASSTVP